MLEICLLNASLARYTHLPERRKVQLASPALLGISKIKLVKHSAESARPGNFVMGIYLIVQKEKDLILSRGSSGGK